MFDIETNSGPGPLILAGGAEFNRRMATADRVWLGLLNRESLRLGVLPTASEHHPELAAANGVSHFSSLNIAAKATLITGPQSAADKNQIAEIEQLDAAYMAGGNPIHLADVLAGSPAWRTLESRWRQGMALGGSSAGAMVLCETIFVQNGWAEGLGLVGGAVVLPHFDNRDEAGAERAREAVSSRGLLGLGIDESTALIWHGGIWRAAGPGRVVLLSKDGVSKYIDGQVIDGLPAPGERLTSP